MGRVLSRGVIVLCLGSALMVAAARPASAANEVCTGTGTAATSEAFGYEASGAAPVSNASFTFALNLGTCTVSSTLTAAGVVSGYCWDSLGSGVANGHHDFTFVGTGGVLVFDGQVQGAATVEPDTLNGHSCIGNNASQFIVTGLWLLT